jgi:integrase
MNKILSLEEIEALLVQVRPLPNSYYWSAVLGVMAYAGLSEDEVIELLSEDVDLEAGFIQVRGLDNAADDRQVKISAELLTILEMAPRSRSQYLFPNPDANSKKWYKSSFDLELKKRLPEDLSASSLSHSFGTL